MRRLGFFLSFCLLLSFSTFAEEVKPAESKNPAAAADDVEETIEIVIPAAEEVEVFFPSAPRPDCKDPALSEGIIHKIKAYQEEHPSSMLIEKRRDILLLKNLAAFKEVSVNGFTAKQDFNVANAIIMAKINKGLHESDLLLCKSQGKGRAQKIYALVYPVGDGHVVDIINFLPEGADKADFSFIFN